MPFTLRWIIACVFVSFAILYSALNIYIEHAIFDAVRINRSNPAQRDMNRIADLAFRFPSNGRILHAYGRSLAVRGQCDDAIPILNKAALVDFDYFIHLNLAGCYESAGDFDQVFREYRTILAYAPFSPETLKSLARSSVSYLSQLPEAVPERTIQSLQSIIDTLRYGRYDGLELTPIEMAVGFVSHSVWDCPETPRDEITQAICLLNDVRTDWSAGDYPAALQTADRIIDFNPSALRNYLPFIYMRLYNILDSLLPVDIPADYHYIRAFILTSGGNIDQAQVELDKCLMINSDFHEAIKLRAQIAAKAGK